MTEKTKRHTYFVIMGLIVLTFLSLNNIVFQFSKFNSNNISDTFSNNIVFVGERVIQIDRGSSFNYEDFIIATDIKGIVYPVIINGDYDVNVAGTYFLTLIVEKEGYQHIKAEITLIVFSEEDYEY